MPAIFFKKCYGDKDCRKINKTANTEPLKMLSLTANGKIT